MKKIDLSRFAKPANNLLSALGPVKETRLTAVLAYLFYENPALAKDLFNLPKEPVSVEIEHMSGEKDRFDIVLTTRPKKYVVEAKLGPVNREDANRYKSRKVPHCIIGNDIDCTAPIYESFYSAVTWDHVHTEIKASFKNVRGKNSFYLELGRQFLEYLEEQHMTKRHYKDVYVRDLSGPSVDLYFNKNFYHAQGKFFASASKARYFAPFLTQSNMIGENRTPFRALGVGISYFSKINEIKCIQRKNLLKFLLENGYSKKDAKEIDNSPAVGDSPNADIIVLLLGKALRLVQAPITKKQMWPNGNGAMPSITIDFTDLIGCANGTPLVKKKKP